MPTTGLLTVAGWREASSQSWGFWRVHSEDLLIVIDGSSSRPTKVCVCVSRLLALTDVPSLTARSAAALNVQPLLNLYPLPNGPERPDGFAEFASSFANAGRHDVGSLHIDGLPNDKLMLSGYYSIYKLQCGRAWRGRILTQHAEPDREPRAGLHGSGQPTPYRRG